MPLKVHILFFFPRVKSTTVDFSFKNPTKLPTALTPHSFLLDLKIDQTYNTHQRSSSRSELRKSALASRGNRRTALPAPKRAAPARARARHVTGRIWISASFSPLPNTSYAHPFARTALSLSKQKSISHLPIEWKKSAHPPPTCVINNNRSPRAQSHSPRKSRYAHTG